jgi:hypothetical protein
MAKTIEEVLARQIYSKPVIEKDLPLHPRPRGDGLYEEIARISK